MYSTWPESAGWSISSHLSIQPLHQTYFPMKKTQKKTYRISHNPLAPGMKRDRRKCTRLSAARSLCSALGDSAGDSAGAPGNFWASALTPLGKAGSRATPFPASQRGSPHSAATISADYPRTPGVNESKAGGTPSPWGLQWLTSIVMERRLQLNVSGRLCRSICLHEVMCKLHYSSQLRNQHKSAKKIGCLPYSQLSLMDLSPTRVPPNSMSFITDLPFWSILGVHKCPIKVWDLMDTPHDSVATLWWTNIAIEHGPVEIVDFPINSMVVIFHCKLWHFTRGYPADPQFHVLLVWQRLGRQNDAANQLRWRFLQQIRLTEVRDNRCNFVDFGNGGHGDVAVKNPCLYNEEFI